jgi:hypothetical protein
MQQMQQMQKNAATAANHLVVSKFSSQGMLQIGKVFIIDPSEQPLRHLGLFRGQYRIEGGDNNGWSDSNGWR